MVDEGPAGTDLTRTVTYHPSITTEYILLSSFDACCHRRKALFSSVAHPGPGLLALGLRRWPMTDGRSSKKPERTKTGTDVMMECRRSARNVPFLSCRCSCTFVRILSISLSFSTFPNAYSYAYESSSHTRPTHILGYYKRLTYC